MSDRISLVHLFHSRSEARFLCMPAEFCLDYTAYGVVGEVAARSRRYACMRISQISQVLVDMLTKLADVNIVTHNL
jgi:hypothetical protein